MSLFDCIDRAMNDPEIAASKERGKRAQAMWTERADQYESDGHPRHVAEQLAAEDVKEAFRREAGEKRHAYLSVASFQRKAQAHVAQTAKPDMTRRMEELDFKHRGMVRSVQGRLSKYLSQHHRDILGRITNPAEQAHLADELHGIQTGNQAARELAESVNQVMEDLRLQFNAAGGMISKLDNWGVQHVHDKFALMKVGKQDWARRIDAMLDWNRIKDPLTGRPMLIDPRTGMPPESSRMSYLGEVYDNIVHGKEADDPVYGRPKGVATYRKHMDSRSLHFKDGKTWMEYNRDFGTGGLHQSIMGHVHRMARDIVLMREFGPNPKLGAEYEADLWSSKAKAAGDDKMGEAVRADSNRARRMLDVMSGGGVPQSPSEQIIARGFSTVRSLATAAFLDRAIIASFSDLNSMRMAAKSAGLNGNSLISKQLGVIKTLSPAERARAGWVADTLADAGSALARFQQDFAAPEWAERVTQASMRIQGLSAWTDRARATAYFDFAGLLMEQSDRAIADLDAPLRALLQKWDVKPDEWDAFRAPDHVFTADNGATFLAPLNFRNVSTLDPRKTDQIFFKMQGVAEEFLELAVPSRSLLAQSFVDPSAYNLPPGSIGYEFMKSATMFKSFTMTFTVNQYRQIQARGGFRSQNGALYGLELAAGATILGAISLQIGDMMMGRDPQDMTQPGFWARAAAKGGGFGIVGDIVSTGQASWGGGFTSYVAGPIPQIATDVWGLTLGNAFTAAYQAAQGKEVDVNLAEDIAKFGKRYTPMGQTPLVGPAIDRLFWDQLQLLIDPESIDGLAAASKKRENLTGAGEFWMPGSAIPSRVPNLGAAIGQ